MRKKTLVAIVLGVILAGHAFGEWRIDVGADIPWGIGTVVSGYGDTSQGGVNVLQNFVFIVPEANMLYQFPVGPVNLGVGVRAFSLVLETIAWPNAFAEVNVGPVAIDFNIGGGAFLFFGLYTNLTTSAVIIPDLSAYFKLGKIFRIGLGGMLFYNPQTVGNIGYVPYTIYLSGKFSFKF